VTASAYQPQPNRSAIGRADVVRRGRAILVTVGEAKAEQVSLLFFPARTPVRPDHESTVDHPGLCSHSTIACLDSVQSGPAVAGGGPGIYIVIGHACSARVCTAVWPGVRCARHRFDLDDECRASPTSERSLRCAVICVNVGHQMTRDSRERSRRLK
jgi:hypothetical protein